MLTSYSFRCSFALILILGCALCLPGQITTGEITGTVMDSSGAAVAGATVTAVCPETNQTRSIPSGAAGEYTFYDMPNCTYKVSVAAQGFKTTVRNVRVDVAQTTKADFRLEVGQRTETITVEAASPLVEFTTGVNNEVDTKSIVDLPTEGRDFKSILALTPGVQRAPGGGFLDVSISGQRSTTNNYMIDGMPNNDRFYGSEVIGQPGILGVPASVLGSDSIAEYTVQELPSADNGVKGGAAINVTLKSGTNDFHGTAFYFGDYDWLNARNFFASTTLPYHNHNYGATVGGPIKKDRTFFFFTFEGQRNTALEPYNLAIPTQGDLAAALADFANPATNPTGIPLNTAGLNLLKYYPCSDGAGGIVSCTPSAANAAVPTGGFTQSISSPNTDKLSSYIIRIDHKMNDKMQLSGRYTFADSTQTAPLGGYTLPPAPGSGLPADAFNTVAPTRVQLAGATWTYSMSPNKILDVRFNWSRYAQILDPLNKVNPLSLGIDTGPLNPADFGVPPVYASSITYGNPGGIQGYPLSTRPTQTYDVSTRFSWSKGTHNFKFGGNYQYASTFSLRNRARTGLFSFQTDFETLIDQLLTGRLDRASRSFGDTSRHLYQPSVGLFFQDEWKVTPRLTVSYGLRWDINGALGDADKNASNFFPCAPPEPTVCAPKGFPNGLVQVQQGFPRLYDLDLKDFGPRGGVAWDVFGNGKTALRVGYAMAYDVANFAAISAPYAFQGARAGAFTNSDLGVFSVTANGNGDASLPTLFQAFNANTCYNPATNTATPAFVCIGPQPGSGVAGSCAGAGTIGCFQTFGANPTGTPPFNIFGTIPNLKTPRIQYYNATIQHEIFRNNAITVSYLGSHGSDTLLSRSLNSRPVGCWDTVNDVQLTTGNCARPFDSLYQLNGVPNFSYVIQLNNEGYLRYNALQVTYRQRDWHGLNTIVNFTWSNCIDNNSTNRGGGSFLPIEENPYNPSSNEGPCDSDVRRNFNTGITYDFPRVRALGRLGEGWQTGSVVTVISGRPWTPLLSQSADESGQDLVQQRPDCSGVKPIYQFSDPNSPTITNASAIFSTPAPNTIGTCGRNSLRGPNFRQWDFNLNKTTKLTERLSLQLRFEVFNLLNHPNFYYLPSSAKPSSGSFSLFGFTPDIATGNPFLSQGGARAAQLGAKVIF
ncbi:MAG TPA: carboxypeptidase regulatory-like domain-containing protein [Candidatus Acidoferrum sp.]|nr:carboxypeptidase regulatory-like domain-containing protein [Candidatus Acidoferrum sp.]